ncbi:sugar ABC transporter permease [Paenibacillus glycanilyticus]|uniref:carbohydrate ABC transporter permease n=1 Tax=Paenibacillus glycanilyticus TaxID=126569 RepID=UPI00203D2644|nr:sugar ABC transporter permease [Paenibacillus glycanilyticus]MCM3626280.1 sugar ABC transporter permease [Paenibacillus glycanilyticus]
MLKPKRTSRKVRYDNSAYFYLLPALLLLAVFIVYPITNTLITSFKGEYRFLTGDFEGYSWQNYIEIIKDPIFRRAIMNTLFIAFVCIPASMAIALFLSLILNSVQKWQGFFMTLFYLPQVTNVIAAGIVFAFMFNTNFGVINMILGWFGIEPVAWISGQGIASSPELYHQAYARCLFIVFVYTVWQGLSLKIILFLSGLQNINKQYYQAAKVDGTSFWRTIRKITLPLLSPTTLYVFITSVITAFKAYAQVIALFGKQYGPAGDGSKMMITIVGYMMDSMGDYLSPGSISKASSAAMILVVMVMIVTAVQIKISKKWVHYN